MFVAGICIDDIALTLMLAGLAALAWRQPWQGVLGLAVLDFLHPQGYAQGFMQHFPVYASLFVVVLASALFALARGRLGHLPRRLLRDWRLYALLGLWLWFAVTSHYAIAPWEAWPKFFQVARLLPPLLLTLWLIDDRQKLHALIVTIALSITLIAIKGGYWALITGFQDRVYGPPGSQYADNNEFAVAVCMAIPLLALWLHETRDRWARTFLLVGMALCFAAALSSWSRGGMLTLAATGVVLLLHARRKWSLAAMALATVLLTQMPQSWFERMQTLGLIAGDESAQSRLAVWRVGLDFAAQHPLTGGGFNAWPVLTQGVATLDWHSVYVQIAAEHGYVGLILWAGLLLGNLAQLAWSAWLPAHNQPRWAREVAAMLFASTLAYLVGGATLGIAYWTLPYQIVTLAMLLPVLVNKDTQP